jgi:hypothetical protein
MLEKAPMVIQIKKFNKMSAERGGLSSGSKGQEKMPINGSAKF